MKRGNRIKESIAAALVVTLVVFFFYKERAGALSEKPYALSSSIDVTWVIDGDTIELRGGTRIRYVGIDTPEREEPFYKEARAMNIELLKADGELRFEPCTEEVKDRYGRLLGWVYKGNVDVGERLLREGLAKTLTIPPCGLVKRDKYSVAEAKARGQGIGIWSIKKR